ncbi:MAG: hypothetical protein JRH05_05940, partial [Deltaproteobacteria bacterium]|nr:hypothetical protein [Deltaproteobacteria bacterium]
MSGNDGRFRGHLLVGIPGERISAAELMKRTGVAVVRSLEGALLRHDELIQIGDKVKAVLVEGRSTLLLFADASPM